MTGVVEMREAAEVASCGNQIGGLVNNSISSNHNMRGVLEINRHDVQLWLCHICRTDMMWRSTWLKYQLNLGNEGSQPTESMLLS
jgi:hypothetical protein